MASMRQRLGLWLIGKQVDQAVADSIIAQLHSQSEPPTKGTAELIAAYKMSPWLRAVTHKIAHKFASVPWKLYSIKQNGKRVRNKTAQTAGYEIRQPILRRFKQAGALEEINDHPMLDLLASANPSMSGNKALKVTQLYLDLKGETLWIIERSADGTPLEYWPMPPNWVVETPTTEKPWFVVQIKRKRRKIPIEDAIWFSDPDPSDPYGRGTGIAESLGDDIDVDEYASKMIKATFFNRAKPDILVAIEGAKQDQIDVAQERWNNQHQGFNRHARAHFHGGKMSVKELQHKFSELQLSELRTWERDTFVNVYGIPPEILGILTSSNRATITEARNIFATEVLIPRLEFFRTELQNQLVPGFDDRLIIDFESPAPDDYDYALEGVKAAPWAFELGEIRELFGARHRGDGDRVHMVPANLFPVANMANAENLPTTQNQERAIDVRELPEASQTTKDASAELVIESLYPDRITAEVNPLYAQQVEAWGNAELASLGLDPSFNMLKPGVVEAIEGFSVTRVNDINATTQAAMRKTLSEGVAAGEGVPKLAARAREVMGEASRTRSITIARTEVNTAANFATWEGQRQSGIVQRRQWITTLIGSRHTHANAHMQIRGMNEPFSVGGIPMMYPGEFGAPPAEVVNCRCTTAALVSQGRDVDQGLSVDEAEQIWRAFDKKLREDEIDMARAFRRGFEAQEADVLAAIERVYG